MALTAIQAWDELLSSIRRDLGRVDGEDMDAIVAGLLRRAAAARSPCLRPDLVEALNESLADMAPPEISSRENLDRVVDQLLASGDLIEVEREIGRSLIYLSPPRFVARRNSILVMGGRADTGLPLSPELQANLTSRHSHRFVSRGLVDDPTATLQELGFFPFPLDAWTSSPDVTEPTQLVKRLDERLSLAGRAGDMPELVVLDQGDTNTYYRSRWKPAGSLSGRYVGRRVQKWGAALWCYVELEDGAALRFIDLPVIDRRFRACDEAWWTQFAIDAVLGHPQEIRIDQPTEDLPSISVRLPLPGWAARRLLLVGDLLPRAKGKYLFTYSIEEDEVVQEVAFLNRHLWCHQSNDGSQVG